MDLKFASPGARMTAGREELLALAERCEQATGPDRELDAAIHAEMAKLGWQSFGSLLDFTACIDAAMTLRPEEMDWSLGQAMGFRAVAHLWMMGLTNSSRCLAATPALALTAAALRARAATPAQGEGDSHPPRVVA